MQGRTIALYSDSGAGKTTLAGEYAKHIFKTTGKHTIYNTADLGGFDSIRPLVDLGVIRTNEFSAGDDPWIWISDAVNGGGCGDDVGLAVFESGTSMGEALMSNITHSGTQMGQQKTQKFTVASGAKSLQVGINNEAHYGLVQNFMLDQIWRSTSLAARGIDVIWTFATFRGESVDSEPIIGPKLVGKALTASIPKWFKYTFRIVNIPSSSGPSRHVLYLQSNTGENGIATSFGNARYPMEAVTPLPVSIEPASLVGAINLVEAGQQEAMDALKVELGL